MVQESTFVRDIKSTQAYGLMQMMPSTGRQYARKPLRHSLRLLIPGNQHQDGDDTSRTRSASWQCTWHWRATTRATPRRWMREFEGLPQDEFIDSIPYPETQQYVKRLIKRRRIIAACTAPIRAVHLRCLLPEVITGQ
jgi:soluble lytic murein transglycosylase